MCGAAEGRALTRPSGSNLRMQTPDQRGRRRAAGKLDRADAPFIEVLKEAGEIAFFVRNTHAGRLVFPHIDANPTHPPDQRGGTEWPAAIRPGKSPISNRSRRASRATRS